MITQHSSAWTRIAPGLALLGILGVLASCAAVPEKAVAADETAAVGRYDQALHDLLPADIRERGLLRVGTDASYAPMSTFGPDGRTIVGSEPDLGRALGEVLGVDVEFVHRDFMRILPEVRDGSLDLGMSAMTDTRERERKVDFVTYFSAGTAVLVQHGNPEGISGLRDLCGKKVAVEDGTTQVDLLARAQSHCAATIRVRRFATNSDALLQLRTGRVAAALNDLPPAVYLVSDPRTAAQFQFATTTQYEPGLYGVAVAKNRPGLREAVQAGLSRLVDSGVYAEVLSRWKIQEGAVGQVTVNSGR